MIFHGGWQRRNLPHSFAATPSSLIAEGHWNRPYRRTRLFAASLAVLLAGLPGPSAAGGELKGKSEWVEQVRFNAAKIERLYRQLLWARCISWVQSKGSSNAGWACSATSVRETHVFIFALQRKVERRLEELWRISGHCEFADIAKSDLVKRAPDISRRYRALLRRYEGVSLPRIYKDALKANLALLRTEYCWPAFEVTEHIVSFDQVIEITGGFHIDLPADCRALIRSEMTAWFERNRESLEWDPELCRFRHRWEADGFILPPRISPILHAGLSSKPASLPISIPAVDSRAEEGENGRPHSAGSQRLPAKRGDHRVKGR